MNPPDSGPYSSPRTPTHLRSSSRPPRTSFPFPEPEEDVGARLLEEEEAEEGKRAESPVEEQGWEGMTPLDETLVGIGFGKYQKQLLVLCGFGWMADNMWLQCVAVILPRVQEHYGVSDRWIGLLSASIFAGMMVGAWGWGSYSDSKGRMPAFNLTLLVTSVFGLLSAFAPSFPWLCFALFGLGTGVGGSMPTDGTLFLENIPKTHHYLLTALSGFFSLGAVLTSLLGLYIIPRHSCPELPLEGVVCDVSTENRGWRYMLGCLGLISITMSLSRILFFRLQESAKFLVTTGRTAEAIIALQRISRINGEPQTYLPADVVDHAPFGGDAAGDYEAMGESPVPGEGRERGVDGEMEMEAREEEGSTVRDVPRTKVGRERGPSWIDRLPVGVAQSVDEYLARMEGLFEPRWAKTTKLVWTIWGLASAGYTIFNVFLPKFLEEKVGAVPGGRQKSLQDYVIYTMSGLPGSLIGAYLIETSWGRRGTMAVSTVATSLGTLVFVLVSSQAGVVLSSMAVSLAATLMYAVIYGYTPEVFESRVRGTACGIASALSRLAGILAPILTGLLLSINVSLPLFVSAVCFAVTAGCMLALPYETRGAKGIGKGVSIGH